MKSENPLRAWLDSLSHLGTHRNYRFRLLSFLAYINPALYNEKLSGQEREELAEQTAKDLLETRRKQILDPDTEGDMSRTLKQFYVDLVKGRVKRLRRYPKLDFWKLLSIRN